MNLLRQIGVAILTDGYVLDIRNLGAHCVEACFDRQRGKSAEVFMAVQTLLGNGELHFAIEHDRCRSIGVKHIEAQESA